MHPQQGSGVLIMVVILLLLGAALLHSTRQQLSDNLSLVMDEQHYIRQYTQAASALAWGEQVRWPYPSERVACQQQMQYGWRACLQLLQSGMLLRADSGPDTIALYRWVTRRSADKIRAIPHGWLDYCPVAASELCNV